MGEILFRTILSENLFMCLASWKSRLPAGIIHVNDGSDGTLDFVKKSNFKFTHSKENIGLCSSMNNAYKLSTSDFLLCIFRQSL